MHPIQREQPGVERRVERTGCQICPTPQGRGNYLVAQDGVDVLVLAPPGVRVPTEPGVDPPLCSDGWRLATFVPRDGQEPLLDQHRPASIVDIGVRGALEEILLRCPERLTWFADRVEEMIRSAWMISQPDINGDVPLLASTRADERDEMLEALVPALQDLSEQLPPETDRRLLDPFYLVELRDTLDEFTRRDGAAGAGWARRR